MSETAQAVPSIGPGPVDSAALTVLHDLFPGRLAPSERWGLGKVRALLASAGNPERTFPTLHIGGTNGKGSVSAMVESVLRSAGYRTGLFTSPHLIDFNERIRVEGRPAPETILRDAASAFAAVVESENPAFFELAAAVAFRVFAEQQIDIAVVEVGLGGRLDATNVIDPLAVAVTNIGLDHSALLGNTHEAVAREKAGIAKPGIDFLTTETDAAVRATLCARAEALGARPASFGPAEIVWVEGGPSRGPRARVGETRWGPLEFVPALRGRHQALNTLLAIRLLERLPERFALTAETVVRGLEATRWPGRLDLRVREGRPWLFDIAHNPEGAVSLADSLGGFGLPRPCTLLFAVLADKEWRSMLPALAPHVERIVLCQPPSVPPSRRWNPMHAWEWIRETLGRDALLEPDFARAVALAGEGEGSCLVTGSVHTVGDTFDQMGIRPFPAADED